MTGITSSLQAGDKDYYPISEPREEGYLQVSAKHQIFYAVYGNPDGIPVVVLHGGPGLGCSNELSRFFDLTRWNVIMFDQRGAMRSRPFACMEENTTEYSISDIEALREHLKIPRWVVFGGSWGSCLGLLYGQKHPQACLGFILRGIFLGREEDITFFKNMGKASPSTYLELLSHLEEEERKDLPLACYQRIMNPDSNVHMDIARALMRYQMMNSSDSSQMEEVLQNDQFVLSFMRSFLHYAVHLCFLEPNQILSQMERIHHLPAIIVHGSSDAICATEQAILLHSYWKRSELWIIEGAGHSWDEPKIANALVRASDSFMMRLSSYR